jgi:uncharacterized RDD family membrane protein YckC
VPAGSTRPPATTGYVTPDAVAVDLPSATVGSRAVAYLIDLVLLGTGLVALAIAQSVFGAAGWVPDWAGILLVLLFAFLWQFGYPIGFETLWGGRTPGKAAMGLRVVTTEGAPVGVRHATIRATVGLFELTGTAGTVAVISSLISSRGQRLGDLAGGTLVVRERLAAPPPTSEVFVAPPGLETYAARLDVGRLGPTEYGTIRDTLRRAASLPPQVRERVTGQLATALAPRVSPPPPAGVVAEDWLRAVASAVQAAGGGRATLPPIRPATPRSTPPPVASAPSARTSTPPGPATPAVSATPPSPTTPASGPDRRPADERGDGFAPPS